MSLQMKSHEKFGVALAMSLGILSVANYECEWNILTDTATLVPVSLAL